MAKLLQVTKTIAMYNCMSHPRKNLGKQDSKPNGCVPENYAGRRWEPSRMVWALQIL